MISSKNETEQYLILRAIEENSDVHYFRTNIFPNHLAPTFDSISDKKQNGYSGTFNDVTLTLIRPNLSFSFNGLMELALLELGTSKVVLTGEIMKGNLSHAHMYFQLPTENPIEEISTIFSKIHEAFDAPSANGNLSSIDNVDEFYQRKILPLVPC